MIRFAANSAATGELLFIPEITYFYAKDTPRNMLSTEGRAALKLSGFLSLKTELCKMYCVCQISDIKSAVYWKY